MGNPYTGRLSVWLVLFALVLLSACSAVEGPAEGETEPAITTPAVPKGKLFIIGGGSRPDSLMQRMYAEAEMQEEDYTVVLTMSSSEPDTSFYYSNRQFVAIQENPVHHFNLTLSDVVNKKRLDSLSKARVIYITGGDQRRFMNVAADNPIAFAIRQAYEDGALVGGTSAGAAVMSEIMITGDEQYAQEYSPTYQKIWKDNGVYEKGLGLINWAVIDQHFVVRSRYNRLFSALVDHPGLWGVGIDESTALLISNGQAEVCGESQVVVMQSPTETRQRFLHSGLSGVQVDVLLAGDSFDIP